ncbi:MAG: hypothetical protein LBS79_04190 [Tannerella sp.]|jgi:hypothetical protein|nr:hypothetical protein [Tannerella sp.]
MESIRFSFLKYAVMAFSMLLFSNCEEKEPDSLSVSLTRLSFTADDTKKETVTVTTNVDAWGFKVSDNWVIVEKEIGELLISVQKYNETGEPRQAEITISAGTADPVTIKITQIARDNLSVTPESLSYDADETGGKTVAITTSAQSWDATTDASSWINLGKQGNTLTVTVSSKNTGSSPRTATIRITAGSASEKTVTVTQAEQHTLSVSPSSLSFTAGESGEQTVNVNTTASSWNATTEASWITLNKQGNTLRVSASANTGSSDRNATIIITAGNAPPTTVSVTQSQGMTVYINAEGSYLGNKLNTGTAHFSVDLYNYDTNVGLFISGFCTLPSSFNNFKLTTGTYSVASSGVARTFLPGKVISDTEVSGTTVYNFNTKKFIRITGGTFTVESSGNNYTITTNFTGTDHTTGVTVDNIRATYSGPVVFTCEWGCESVCTPPFGSFCESNFTANGSTPLASGSPGSWSGLITPLTTSSGLNYYKISTWGNDAIPVFCDYKSGKIIIDNYTKVFTEDGKDFYFNALAINQAAQPEPTAEIAPDWEAKYNASTKTLDFSGSYNGNPVAVGLVAKTSTGFSIMHGYFNLKIVLTSTSSAPMPTEGFALKVKASPDAGSKENFLKGTILRIDGAPAVMFKKAPSPINSK